MKRAISISFLYFLFGIGWIFFSDKIVFRFWGNDSQTLLLVENYKGYFYVSFSALLIFLAIKMLYGNMERINESIKLLFTNKEFAVLKVDKSLRILAVSGNVSEILGYSQNEMEGKNILEMMVNGKENTKVGLFQSFTHNMINEFRLDSNMTHAVGHSIPVHIRGVLKRKKENIDYGLLLIQNISERKKEEEIKEKLTIELEERIKEQALLYSISKLMHEPNMSTELFVKEMADLLSMALQYPNQTEACIRIGEKEYYSRFYQGALRRMQTTFTTNYGEFCKIEVVYLGTELGLNKNPFSIEESQLLDSLAEILKNWLEKKQAEMLLKATLQNLEYTVEERTEELKLANTSLHEANVNILESLTYAGRMQQTILPSLNEIRTVFPNFFLFFRPKDLVSGDFYWVQETEDLVYIACGDCTGHGVPGALMSMIGNQLLEHAVQDLKLSDPSEILNEMDKAIMRLMVRKAATHNMSDGMDISLVILDRKKQYLHFSGAVQNGYFVHLEEWVQLSGGKGSLGGNFQKRAEPFQTQKIDYKPGDKLYLFTDGYGDQFGGNDNRKFFRRNLIQLLKDIHENEMEIQGDILRQQFEFWKGTYDQIDDVTVIGIQL